MLLPISRDNISKNEKQSFCDVGFLVTSVREILYQFP